MRNKYRKNVRECEKRLAKLSTIRYENFSHRFAETMLSCPNFAEKNSSDENSGVILRRILIRI